MRKQRMTLRLSSMVVFLVTIGLMALSPAQLPPTAQASDTPSARASTPSSSLAVLRSDQHEVEVAWSLPGFSVEEIQVGAERYQRIVIPGTVQREQPDKAQIPVQGLTLGIPTTSGLRLEVTRAEYDILQGYQLAPAPTTQILGDASGDLQAPYVGAASSARPTATQYEFDTLYPDPGAVAALGEVGLVRDQAVAQVHLYPVQYHPLTRELHLYRLIQVRLVWDEQAVIAAPSAREAVPAFEALLGELLLNYENLNRSSVQPVQRSPMAPVATSGADPALKIVVSQEGLHRLDHEDLVAAGFDLDSMDPRTFRLLNRGREVAIRVTGETDGVFDVADTILFYGEHYEDVYTDENVYWLSAGGGTGRRIGTITGSPGSAPLSTDFPSTLHIEEDTYYWNLMPNGEGEDHWFWGNRLSPNTGGLPAFRDQSFQLHNLSNGAQTAAVRVRLKGYTALDHRTRLHLNGHLIDEQSWKGQSIFDHAVTVPASYLVEGENIVRVEAADAGATVDQILVNWIEIDHHGRYVAENDSLWFNQPDTGTYQYEVMGFSTAEVQVYDVTEPDNVRLVTNTPMSLGGSYGVRFQTEAQAVSRYLVLVPTAYRTPARILMDESSSWRAANNGADYILITHSDFYASALALGEHRAAQGQRVAIVKVEDLYDEFNAGLFSPQAIRDFLAYAYANWAAPAPTYVLLLGDGYQDYKDNLGTGTRNYVPPQVIETETFGQVPSDNWFVTVSGDDILPDLHIGRLSAETPEQASTIVEKLIAYDDRPRDPPGIREVLMVADDDHPTFLATSELLIQQLPTAYAPHRVYVGDYPPGDPTQALLTAFNEGVVLANYTGHGEFFRWGQWDNNTRNILTIPNLRSLSNADRLPILTIANCLNGFFTASSENTSVAEAFQRTPNGGAVAVWAASSVGYPTGHQVLMTSFYDTIFQPDQQTLGVATTLAKLNTYAQSGDWRELVETFILFGDPTTALKLPSDQTAPRSLYLPLIVGRSQ